MNERPRGQSVQKSLSWLCWVCLAVSIIAAAPRLLIPAAHAQSPASASTTLTSTVNGVTVKVTAGALKGRTIEFAIVLDTHSGTLNDDLLQSASVTLPDGSKIKPTAWTGAGPGGHHREGTLTFEIPDTAEGPIELVLLRPGESSPRSFRWQR